MIRPRWVVIVLIGYWAALVFAMVLSLSCAAPAAIAPPVASPYAAPAPASIPSLEASRLAPGDPVDLAAGTVLVERMTCMSEELAASVDQELDRLEQKAERLPALERENWAEVFAAQGQALLATAAELERERRARAAAELARDRWRRLGPVVGLGVAALVFAGGVALGAQ
jgi:hypothetical protein